MSLDDFVVFIIIILLFSIIIFFILPNFIINLFLAVNQLLFELILFYYFLHSHSIILISFSLNFISLILYHLKYSWLSSNSLYYPKMYSYLQNQSSKCFFILISLLLIHSNPIISFFTYSTIHSIALIFYSIFSSSQYHYSKYPNLNSSSFISCLHIFSMTLAIYPSFINSFF